jgi:DNA-binding transcriptional ArsR family regulator
MAERLAGPVDYANLADYLSALAYPVRLELLDKLRYPQALGDIQLSPLRASAGARPQRPASKQSIHAHLVKLIDADLVRTQRVDFEGREQLRYVVNPPKLYALTEELRRLSTMYAGRGGGVGGDVTGTLMASDLPDAVKGPRLVLVHGVYEGKAFALDAKAGPEDRWILGRRRGLAVALDYDPFVSLENAVVERRGSQFVITDLPGSKNGTAVNWIPLAKGGSRALRSGDIIGLGRSRLSFVPE